MSVASDAVPFFGGPLDGGAWALPWGWGDTVGVQGDATGHYRLRQLAAGWRWCWVMAAPVHLTPKADA